MRNPVEQKVHNIEVWTAVAKIASKNKIGARPIHQLETGQIIAGVHIHDSGASGVFAGRCGWYYSGVGRVITDVTSFVWCRDADDPETTVLSLEAIYIPATQAVYICDSDRQARAVAALASENGEMPNIERMIHHER